MANSGTYIIAEIGINHNGGLKKCLCLIDAAADAGCDAVKLQFFKAERLYPVSAGTLKWKGLRGCYSYDIYKAVQGVQLPEEWLDKLIKYSSSKKIELLSSVFDTQGVDLLKARGIKKIKLASCAITNIPLIECCARSGLPIIMSTGGATLSEVEYAVKIITKYHKNLSLLHCSLQYPTELKDCNLGVIKTLGYAFSGLSVGYSDHTAQVSIAAVQAVYLGAKIIEKHITLGKKMHGPDHFFALEPLELKQMVKDIRKAERDFKSGNFKIDDMIFGNSVKAISPQEKYLRDFSFTRIFAGRDIRKGERITVRDLSVLRPGNKLPGLEPKYLRLFEEYRIRAKKDLAFEDPVAWDCILE